MYASCIKAFGQNCSQKRIGYYPYCQYPGLTHLCFADNVLVFSVGNGGYKEICSTTQTWHLMQLVSPKVPWSEGVWFPEETRKHATLVWIAAQNILSTGDRLIKWNPQAVSKCRLCNDPMETRDILFFTCSYAVAMWSNLIQNFLGGRYFYQ